MGNKNIFIDFIHLTIRRLGIYFKKKKKKKNFIHMGRQKKEEKRTWSSLRCYAVKVLRK